MTNRQLRELCEKATSITGAKTMTMCGVDSCVYVSGHGGEHLPHDPSRDLSDEIRIRLVRDQRDRLCDIAVHVPALLDENEKLRAALREALGAWTNMLVEAKGSSQHVDIEHDLSRIDELAELLPVIEISPIAKEHLDER